MEKTLPSFVNCSPSSSRNLQAMSEDSGKFLVKGSMPFYQKNSKLGQINLQTNKFNIKTDNLNFLLDSDLDLTGSFESPILGGSISFNNGFFNFNSTNQSNKKDNNSKLKEDKVYAEKQIPAKIDTKNVAMIWV